MNIFEVIKALPVDLPDPMVVWVSKYEELVLEWSYPKIRVSLYISNEGIDFVVGRVNTHGEINVEHLESITLETALAHMKKIGVKKVSSDLEG